MADHAHTSHFVPSGDVTLHYRLFGKPGATPMLILHGAQYFDSYDWIKVAADLSADRETAAMDMRGFGKSTWSPSKDYSTDAKMDDMRAIMTDRGWKKIVPMVHSMTGRIGLVFAATFPELVEKLIVVDSAPRTPPGTPGIGNKPLIFASIDDAMKSFQGRSNPPRIAHDRTRAEAALRKVEGGWMLTRDPDFSSTTPQWPEVRTPKLNEIEIWDCFAKIVCPIRVVRGTRSDRYTPESLQRIGSYKSVSITEVDSEHDIPSQAPDALAATVREFLART